MARDTAARAPQDGALQLGRIGRAARDWIFGPGLLAAHVGVYLLAGVGLILRDLYRSPNDLRFEEPLTRWGIVVAVHAALVAVGWTAWRVTRQARRPDASPAAVDRWVPTPPASDRAAGPASRASPHDGRIPAEPTGRFRPSVEATPAPDATDVAAARIGSIASTVWTTASAVTRSATAATARVARRSRVALAGLTGRIHARLRTGRPPGSVATAPPETPPRTDTVVAPPGMTPFPPAEPEPAPPAPPPHAVPPTRLHGLSAAALHLDDPESPPSRASESPNPRSLEAAVEFWMARPPTAQPAPEDRPAHEPPDGEPASPA